MYSRKLNACLVITACLLLSASKSQNRELSKESFQSIIDNYLFVDDFNIKPPERAISSKELFWKYSFRLPSPEFKIFARIDADAREMPQTSGSGLEYYHLNRGRIHFLAGRFDEARKVWLSGRARYGEKGQFDRRTDYFLALSFLNLGDERMRKHGARWDDTEVKTHFSNAATFLNWALLMKTTSPDALVDEMSPKHFYNLAAIYFNYGRFAGAYGAAAKGLEFLRKSGRKEYRAELQRILAESYIQNHSYVEAVQVFDSALREDISPELAALVFARVGDIYYDLNNYELAEHNYALGNRVNSEMERLQPAQFILRGESLFWSGKFVEAQKALHYGLEFAAANHSMQPLSDQYTGFASLRLADTYLANQQLDKAKVEYGRVGHEFGNSQPGKIARIRSACLEMPDYGPAEQDRNVTHARNLLEASKNMELPEQARELAWACHVLSYTARERTPEMLSRVREFYQNYPYARRFLEQMIEPVRDFQASKIDEYLKNKDFYSATKFFETNRKNLFPKIRDDLRRDLFVAYLDIYNAGAAAEFYEAYRRLAPEGSWKQLRTATFFAESRTESRKKSFAKEEANLANSLKRHRWDLSREALVVTYLQRLKATSSALIHLPWIFKLESLWAEKDESLVCLTAFPTLGRWYHEAPNQKSKNEAKKEVLNFVRSQLANLMNKDKPCLISLLELEFDVLRHEPDSLAKTYAARKDWSISEELVGVFWSVAEHLAAERHKVASEEVFRQIAQTGPADNTKVKFAKLRLDKTKTEFEKIWD
jgi:tetratricopeptide (TPR) repeat protein